MAPKFPKIQQLDKVAIDGTTTIAEEVIGSFENQSAPEDTKEHGMSTDLKKVAKLEEFELGGEASIDDDVIAAIVGVAATEVEGVSQLGGHSMRRGLAERFGRAERRARGVHVEAGKREAILDLEMRVLYGFNIPEILAKVRQVVANRVLELLGLVTKEINIKITGLDFPGAFLGSMRLAKAGLAEGVRIEDIREIQRSIIQARDEERCSLAAEIHDEPLQMLAASAVRLNLIRDSLITRPDLSQEQLNHAITNLGRAEDSLRRIMKGVFPSTIQDLGLLTALDGLFKDLKLSGMAKTQVHLRVDVKGIYHDWNPPLPVGIVIYRFIQEGLRNILVHSHCTRASITVEYELDVTTLEAVDNGRGIDPGRITSRRKEGHVGLLGLEERLGSVGGNIYLSNRPEGGTSLWGQFSHQAPSLDPKTRWSAEYDFIPQALVESPPTSPGRTPSHSHR